MSKECKKIQQQLASGTKERLSEEGHLHLENCKACQQFFSALKEIDLTLPTLEEFDVKDAVVTSILAKVKSQEGGSGKVKQNLWHIPSTFRECKGAILKQFKKTGSLWKAGVPALALASVCVLAVSYTLREEPAYFKTVGHSTSARNYSKDSQTTAELAQDENKAVKNKKLYMSPKMQKMGERRFEGFGIQGNLKDEIAEDSDESESLVSRNAKMDEVDYIRELSADKRFDLPGRQTDLSGNEYAQFKQYRRKRVAAKESSFSKTVSEKLNAASANEEQVVLHGMKPVPKTPPIVRREKEKGLGQAKAEAPSSHLSEVKQFFRQRSTLQGLSFIASKGYFSNSYLPDNPRIRDIGIRLEMFRKKLFHFEGRKFPSEFASQTVQPFDSPQGEALKVYMHADRTKLNGPTRMLLQVGIKGAESLSRRRPAMDLALVLDTSGTLGVEEKRLIRSLITAFGKARQTGDRFQLIAAGKGGGVLVKPDNFRYGPLSVALQKLFKAKKTEANNISLVQASRQAVQEILKSDDPQQPLGSSSVVIIGTRSLGSSELMSVKGIVHSSAVQGVPVSIIGIGKQIKPEELQEIALSGQGAGRVLEQAGNAKNIIETQLNYSSRAVARAVRLRIRLAEGVKLIEVIGSKRLGALDVKRTKEAEASLDLRMARNLGIKADRGDDEEGVQIIIPTFYSGDAHTILFDVVANGPGPIADVRVRYKDLIQLKNSVSRSRLTLWSEGRKVGPLELNVTKNYLAKELSKDLAKAAKALSVNNAALAVDLLRRQKELLLGLSKEISFFSHDRNIISDIKMLNEYLKLIATWQSMQSNQKALIGLSLEYAASLKVLPVPQGLG